MDSEPQANKHNSWLDRAGHALIAASEKQGCWTFLLGWLKWLTFWSVMLYSVALVLVVLVLSHVGERNVTTAFFTFLPPSLWLLPALPLAVAALLLHWRALVLLAVLLVWFGYDFIGWRPGAGQAPSGDFLRVMTYNRGQHGNHRLHPFKNATQPDLILMQEASNRAASYANNPEYAELPHTRSLGEHTLLSRFAVLEESNLPALPGQSPKAVRFVIDWNGRQVALYSVHLDSPRKLVEWQWMKSMSLGILGFPGSPWEENRKQMQSFWDIQIADAELILKAVQADALPCIVAGDFNSTPLGYIHRQLTRDLGDSHDAAGQGFGLTVPGSTWNPLSGGGPWLRIDYVFYSRHWQALHCITESDSPSQHRALTATLKLNDP